MPYERLSKTDNGALTTVTLARPDSHNALNAALIEELTRCFEEISEDERVRAVVLAGEGSSFCAGADVVYMRETASFSYEENLEDARRLAMMYWTIDECPKPVVARVQGAAMGGGGGLLAALHRRADRLVADPDRRAAFGALLDREAGLFDDDRPTLVHDDLHHDNVVLSAADGGWRLAGVLDWDKAWAGPAESDIARMAFWDGMTGPGFWEVYRAAVPERDGWARRALVHQLLWCLEYAAPTDRHRADTAAVGAALGWAV